MPTLAEWIIIVIILVLVFGASRLPGLGDAIGRAIHGEPKDDDHGGDGEA